MKTNTETGIIAYVQANQHVRVHDLVQHLGISPVAVHKQLNKLIARGVLQKTGKPPLVFYTLAAGHAVPGEPILSFPSAIERVLSQHFLFITPEGKLLYGAEGFTYWAHHYQPRKDVLTLSQEYAVIIERARASRPDGWIDATQKMTETFHPTFVDRLLFADVYSYSLFGRTKLAKLVMHAKQFENRTLVAAVVDAIQPTIERIIAKFSVDAVGFVPPTIPRPVQFMDVLERALSIPLPHLPLAKIIPGDVPVAQKSLSTLGERVINARSSIFPKETGGTQYPRVLLIDDVAGSGASFQETARKLKSVGIGSKHIVAFAIVGNVKGYEVIRQL